MEVDNDKIDKYALALMALTLHDSARAWKGLDWDILHAIRLIFARYLSAYPDASGLRSFVRGSFDASCFCKKYHMRVNVC